MLRTVFITPEQDEYARITALLPTIFPREELPPPDVQDVVAPYLCFYDDDTLIGFAQIFKKPDLQFLRYIAMLPEFRSKGYGGKMLDMILAERGNVPLVLDIEPPDEKAANYEQRIRRLKFYRKHGLVDSGYVFEYDKTPFIILSTGEETAPLLLRKYCEASDQSNVPMRIYRQTQKEQ